MRRPRPLGVSGATIGDMLIFLATLSLAAALLYPAWDARSFREQLGTAISDVEALATAARTVRDRTGRWPSSAAPGVVPPELSGVPSRDSIFSRVGYTLGWSAWEVVDSVEAVNDDPPPAPDDLPPDTVGPQLEPIVHTVGAVTVHSGDVALLAELLEQHADQDSFVLDTMLMLVLPERASAPFRQP